MAHRVKTMTDGDIGLPGRSKEGRLDKGYHSQWRFHRLDIRDSPEAEFAGTSEPQSRLKLSLNLSLPSETPKPPVQTGLVVYPARDTLTIYQTRLQVRHRWQGFLGRIGQGSRRRRGLHHGRNVKWPERDGYTVPTPCGFSRRSQR